MDKKTPAKTFPENEAPEIPKSSTENEEDNQNIPIAAKGSEWIGMRTQFRNTSCLSPVECLFPGIRSIDGESTTVITKLLKGKKADPDVLQQKTARAIWTNPLSSVNERPIEELTSDISISITREIQSESDGQDYDDDDEPKRATHTKRRKRKSDVKMLLGENSSSSMNVVPACVRRKSGSRVKQTDGTVRPKTAEKLYVDSGLSNDADDECMTQSSNDKCVLRKPL